MSAPPGLTADMAEKFGVPDTVWRIPPVRKSRLGDLSAWGFERDGVKVAGIPSNQASINAAWKEATDWRASLDEYEVQAVRFYTFDGHDPVNSALTRGEDLDHIPYIEGLDSALGKASYRWNAQTCYRGVAPPPGVLAEGGVKRWVQRTYPLGSTVDTPGYMSTSSDSTVAAAFAGGSGVIFEVRTREGAVLGELSSVGVGESEVLLPRGVRWRVVGQAEPEKSPHGLHTIYMVPDDEVPYDSEGRAPGFDFPDEPPF